MKTRTSRISLFWNVGAASLVALGAVAQTADSSQPSAPASDPAPVKLPYGADDVLKLSRAQVSEDVTLNYIHNSGTIYNLTPKDIVYLRTEGVSDTVINAMIDQRQNVPADIANQNALQAQAAASAVPQAAAGPDANAMPAAPVVVQPVPFYVPPQPVYVPPEPDPVPVSTLYVIPYGPTGCGYLRSPSVYFGSSYGGGSTVYYVGGGYAGPHFHASGHYGASHRSTVYHMGHH